MKNDKGKFMPVWKKELKNTHMLLLLAVCGVLRFQPAFALTGNTVATGYWGSNSTWSFNGVNRLPACGDTVNIPAGYTVTVNSQWDYTGCNGTIYVIVGGTLQFTNGNKLRLPCSSTVRLLSGALVQKLGAGGGSSTYIEICNVVEWKAGDGPLYGPVTLGGGALPVSLLTFTADAEKDAVELNWATASEINNDYFTVERSSDGIEFSVVSMVKGAGNSTEFREYGLVDDEPMEGKSYYRLKQTDYDGEYTYSPIVSVVMKGKNKFEVLAVNAEASSTQILINDPLGGQREIVITQLDGRVICQKNIELRKGVNRYEYSGCQLNPGIYDARISGSGGFCSRKFMLAQ